jgi:hypothetical protein
MVVGGFGVYAAADFGRPKAQGVIAAGPADAKSATIHAPGPGCRLFLRGHFPEVDQIRREAEEDAASGKKKKSQVGTYKLSGGYAIRLASADGATVLDNYTGKFEQERSYRRISKKGRGYLDVVRTTMNYPLKVNQAGDYQLQVVSLGDKLEPKVEYEIYADRQFPLVYGALGLIMVFLYGLIDTLIKPLRVDSYFALTIGLVYGFLAYFSSTAMPNAPYSVVGVSLMVGGLVGGALAYAVFLAGGKIYQNINRRWQLSLS